MTSRKIKSAYTTSSGPKSDVTEEKERLERDREDELRVLGLKKRYRGAEKSAVDDVSFGVALGDRWALIGPNGAGKTTTLACIRGVVSPNLRRGGLNADTGRNYPVRGTCSSLGTLSSKLVMPREFYIHPLGKSLLTEIAARTLASARRSTP